LRARGEKDAEGFALILVVWFLVLVGAIGAYLVANGRAETAIAHNIRAAASAEALADAGIARAVINQTDAEVSNRWKLDAAAHVIALPSGRIEIRLADETRKINPNLASGALLSALFEVSGVDHSMARRLGTAVADWVSAEAPAPDGVVKPDPYRAAGRSYSAPHAPIESLDELGLVLGMTPQILASVRPYLTIHAEAAAPDVKIAPLVIQRALVMAAKAKQEDEDDAAEPASAQPAQSTPPAAPAGLPPAAVPAAAKPASGTAGDERMIEAQITAHSRDGGVFVRYAVLKLAPEDKKAYAVLDWRRGTLDERAK
jgi:general secretion pathway protein K